MQPTRTDLISLAGDKKLITWYSKKQVQRDELLKKTRQIA
jgi:hypothetical protein